MENNQFKAGDIVRLNSGSPKMTIYWVKENHARCVWFSQDEGKLKGDDIPFACLILDDTTTI